MEDKRYCLSCEKLLAGRKDKKFCDAYCKSNYHYQKAQSGAGSFYARVDRQLKANRKLLKTYNKGGKATVRANVLLELGFDPKFFTHLWRNQKGELYLFVYEYGFLSKMENGKKKFVLITWQDYMN